MERMSETTLWRTTELLRALLRSMAAGDRVGALVHALAARDAALSDHDVYAELEQAIYATLLACAKTDTDVFAAAEKWGALADRINVEGRYNLPLETAGNIPTGSIDPKTLLDAGI